ncbi:MAG: rRNA maturation RNase YbeY [Bacilli bacterium]|nr:rRNA maturation RNase YbeY [Bacilli bacterium]
MIHYNLYGDVKKFDFSVRKVISSVLRTVKKIESLNTEHIMSIILVDNKKIHEINLEYRNIDRPTDVISFAAIDSSSNRELGYELGDIYISIDKVYEQAEAYNHSVMREFAFLVTHGILHLLGYDHIEYDEEQVMFKKQDEVLSILGIKR